MKKTRYLGVGVTLACLILLSGAAQVATATPPATAPVTVQVDDHTGSGISGVMVRYGTSSPTSAYFGSQPTDGSGTATGDLTVGNTYQFRVDYHHGYAVSAPLTVDANSANNVVHFQTILLTLRLETCNGSPLDGGAVRYGPGASYSNSFWPGGPTSSSNPGETEAEFFPGTYSFEMGINHTTEVKSSVVIPNANTKLTWTTTTVTLAYCGQISYGGSSGDSAWFKSSASPASATKELLAGTVNFHFRDYDVIPIAIPASCQYQAAVVTLKLLDHNGNPLSGGTARGGHATPTSWFVSGSTDTNGILREFRDGNLNLSYEMKYNKTTAVQGPNDVLADPCFTFKTNLLTLRLETCTCDPLDGGHARYGVGSTYTSYWFPGGLTGSSAPGETEAEFFPGTYSFEMQYQATAQAKLNVVVPSAGTTVIWKTTTVKLHNGYTIAYGGPTGDSRYFSSPMQLLPGKIWFDFRDPAGRVHRQLCIEGCCYEKTVAIVRVKDHNGAGRPGYYGDWHVGSDCGNWGPTDGDGVSVILILGLPSEDTTVCLNYGSKTDCLCQKANVQSTYCFVPRNKLVISSTDGGTVTDPGEGCFVFDNNTPVCLNGTPDDHYHFVNWTGTAVDANKVCDPNQLDTKVFLHDDYCLKANFAIDQFTLTISSTDGGSVTEPGEGSFVYDYNTPVNLNGILDAHYHFVNWSGTAVDANKVGDPNQFATTVLVDANYALVANIAIDQHDVHLSSSAGGHVVNLGEGDFWVDYGSQILLTTQIDDPCLFVFSHFQGNLWASYSPYVLTVKHDYDIRAVFYSVLDKIYVDDNAPNDVGSFDPNVSDPLENGTQGHPFDSIQEAIEVAAPGSTVMVMSGTYPESLDFLGKSITVVSADPNGQSPASDYPVIEAQDGTPAVTFSKGGDPNTLLKGFVLTEANGNQACGIYADQSQARVENCLIVGNKRKGSAAVGGGGIWASHSELTLVNCTVADNYGGVNGAGLYAGVDSNVVVLDSILWNNLPAEVLADGTASVTIQTSDVTGGYSGTGNLAVDPVFVQPGYWEHALNPGMVVPPSQFYAVWSAGDYHLDGSSPCIDAGDPLADYIQEPAPNGDRVNMGAYGNTSQATTTP